MDGHFQGKFATTFFYSLAQMKSLTTEKNAVQLLDQNIFPNPIPSLFLNVNVDGSLSVDYPYNPFPERAAPDLRIQAGSKAVDVGTVIANVNEYSDDDFIGAAPDAGAYEVGAPLPEYGPRP